MYTLRFIKKFQIPNSKLQIQRRFSWIFGLGIWFYSLFPFSSFSQQDAQYSQYLSNIFYINPAYSGNKDAVSAVLLHRSQWVGVKGAPMTETFTIHTPLKSKKVGVGFQLMNDKIGARNTIGALGSYSYKVLLGGGKLSFGLRAGVYAFQINKNLVEYDNPDDPNSIVNINNKAIVNFDFGTYYSSKRFFSGLTITHLNEDKISSLGNVYTPMERHFTFISGGAIPISEDILLKPSFLVRYINNAPANTDINANIQFREMLNFGVSYRTSRGIVSMINYTFNKNFTVGYSFDLVLNKIGAVTKGNSHEIFIGYDVDIIKEKTLSPRFM